MNTIWTEILTVNVFSRLTSSIIGDSFSRGNRGNKNPIDRRRQLKQFSWQLFVALGTFQGRPSWTIIFFLSKEEGCWERFWERKDELDLMAQEQCHPWPVFLGVSRSSSSSPHTTTFRRGSAGNWADNELLSGKALSFNRGREKTLQICVGSYQCRTWEDPTVDG